MKTEQYTKRSQSQIHLDKKIEEVTNSDISELRMKSFNLFSKFYAYGQQRFNYVSKDKRRRKFDFASNIDT